MFVGCIAIVFGTGLVILTNIASKLITKKQLLLSKQELIILTLACVGIICIMYGYFVEPYLLSVTHISLKSSKIHSTNRPIRIVQISDLHCDSKPRLEKQLPQTIAKQKPDIIVFTGDALNTPAGLPILQDCLKQLANIAPTYVVKGNWDSRFFTEIERFKNTGVIELDGKPVKLTIANNSVWLAGLPVDTNKTVENVMHGIPEDEYRIFLFHYPDCLEEMARNKIDLYLAGHTHGGQVALPFYGAIITLAATGKKYEAGLYKMVNTYLYVNRGIGMEGGIAPRVRFCARPEITVIDIIGAN